MTVWARPLSFWKVSWFWPLRYYYPRFSLATTTLVVESTYWSCTGCVHSPNSQESKRLRALPTPCNSAGHGIVHLRKPLRQKNNVCNNIRCVCKCRYDFCNVMPKHIHKPYGICEYCYTSSLLRICSQVLGIQIAQHVRLYVWKPMRFGSLLAMNVDEGLHGGSRIGVCLGIYFTGSKFQGEYGCFQK